METISMYLVIAIAMLFHNVNAQLTPVTPPIYIFGDSTADVGTNNFLPESIFKANFLPNGVDFPVSIPTGRFSNGLNSADFLAILIGLEISPPPFLSLGNNTEAIKAHSSIIGMNFASAGSGIFDGTGKTVVNGSMRMIIENNVVSLGEQMQQFKSVYDILVAEKSQAQAKSLISKSLFFISIGSNDILEFHHSNASTPKRVFRSLLTTRFEFYLRALLQLGARKLGIISVPPLGCCPSQRIFSANGSCSEELNAEALTIHTMTEALMHKLSLEYKDMKYSVGNTYVMTVNVIENHATFGLKDVVSACCGAGKLNGEVACTPTSNVCQNRSEYLFWDLFHPSQAAAQLAALTLYAGGPRFVAPINFSQLAKSD